MTRTRSSLCCGGLPPLFQAPPKGEREKLGHRKSQKSEKPEKIGIDITTLIHLARGYK